MRKADGYFEPVQKVSQEFERIHGVQLSEFDTGGYAGKRLRVELLVQLKDCAGMRYSELAGMWLFSDLSISGLRAIYHRTRKNG